jgi:two-component system, chemotaxis family, protein-glutamate methylesterase/glutaminase
MANRNVIVIGASAGGIDALRFIASQFPRDLNATVLVTVHLSAEFPSQLDLVLTSAGQLSAVFASDGERYAKGRIYIAPPTRHLLIYEDRLVLGIGPRENFARPAIDPMLRSAAACCAGRSVGVVLTGTLGDGAAGLQNLKECGGVTVVQDPADAAFPDMPSAALRRSSPDYVAPLSDIPGLLRSLVEESAGEPKPVPGLVRLEVEIAKSGSASMEQMDRIGKRSVFSCPSCGGVMWEIRRGELTRYRCHVGHAYTAEMVESALDEEFEDAMARVLRTQKERLVLVRQLEMQTRDKGWDAEAASWRRKAEQAEEEAAVLTEAIRQAHEIGVRYAAPSDKEAERAAE